MSVVGLDHVQVAAPRGCEAEARRLYGTLLGLVEVEKERSGRVARRSTRGHDYRRQRP